MVVTMKKKMRKALNIEGKKRGGGLSTPTRLISR
jgi:hypothetical protein